MLSVSNFCKCGKSAECCCAKCRKTFYCSRICQTNDWSAHKSICNLIIINKHYEQVLSNINAEIYGNILIAASHYPDCVIFIEINESIDGFIKIDKQFHFAYLTYIQPAIAADQMKTISIGELSATNDQIVTIYIFKDKYMVFKNKKNDFDLEKLKNKHPKPEPNWMITFDV